MGTRGWEWNNRTNSKVWMAQRQVRYLRNQPLHKRRGRIAHLILKPCLKEEPYVLSTTF